MRGVSSRGLAERLGFWRGPSAWRAWLLVGLLIATVLLQLLTQYWLNFWNCDFFNAIERKDGLALWVQALHFIPLAGASLTLAVSSVWARMTMQRRWREWLSSHLYDYWLQNDRYRRLNFMLGEHQTPEYRIAEDARVATDLPIDLTLGLFSSVLTAIIFIGVLWSVGGGLVIDSFGLGTSHSRISCDRRRSLLAAADGRDDAHRPPPNASD